MEEFGLHYKWAVKYLKREIDYKEMKEKSLQELFQYAKSQMTWFKRDKRIKWMKNYKEAEKLVREFLKEN